MLGRCCCAWAFSSCGEQRLLFVVVWGISLQWPLVAEHRLWKLWHTGPVAMRHVGSSQARARTPVPCSRWILNHRATREVSRGLIVLQVPPGPGIQPAVGGVTETPFPSWGPPVETGMSLEDVLAWMLHPRTGARLWAFGGQTQGTDSTPLLLSLPMLGVLRTGGICC